MKASACAPPTGAALAAVVAVAQVFLAVWSAPQEFVSVSQMAPTNPLLVSYQIEHKMIPTCDGSNVLGRALAKGGYRNKRQTLLVLITNLNSHLSDGWKLVSLRPSKPAANSI